MYFPILAQVDVLKDNLQIAKDTSDGWDSLWKTVINKNNFLWESITQFALMLVSMCFVFFAVKFASEALERRLIPAFQHLLWLMVVMALLANNGDLLASSTLGLRNFSNAQTQGILEASIAGATMSTAIKDVLITNDVKNQIQAQITDCESKTGQAQIDCFQTGAADAQKQIDQAESKYGPLKGLARLWTKLQQSAPLTKGYSPGGSPAAMILVGTVLESGLRLFLKGCQWAFTTGVELASLITSLFGPVAVAISCIPTSYRPFWSWLSGFWGLTLVQFSYNVMIGLVATVYTISDLTTYSDIGFLILMGIIAPFMATALGAGGGLLLLRALTGVGNYALSKLTVLLMAAF